MTWLTAACDGRTSSSSTARLASRKRSPPLWDGVPVQRCTVHKHRNLLAHAPDRLHDEVSADYTDMIYAASHRRDRSPAQSVHPQMAAEMPRRRRQPGRS